jgi:hypothetical protein
MSAVGRKQAYQTHFIGKNAIDALVVQVGQPIHAFDLKSIKIAITF